MPATGMRTSSSLTWARRRCRRRGGGRGRGSGRGCGCGGGCCGCRRCGRRRGSRPGRGYCRGCRLGPSRLPSRLSPSRLLVCGLGRGCHGRGCRPRSRSRSPAGPGRGCGPVGRGRVCRAAGSSDRSRTCSVVVALVAVSTTVLESAVAGPRPVDWLVVVLERLPSRCWCRGRRRRRTSRPPDARLPGRPRWRR